MKSIVLIIMLATTISAQQFTVEKISGKIAVLQGTSENWKDVTEGMTLSGEDILTTDPNAFVQLNNNGDLFILKGNSVLGLNYVKKISINDLLLALAMEEIRNLPQEKKNSDVSNTAVYGNEVNIKKNNEISTSTLGIKRLNGAKQLAEYGYTESAIIAARETYRKYPQTRTMFAERLYFADLLMELKLYEEAASEYQKLKQLELSPTDTTAISERMETLKKVSTSK